jgi:hypothetical protein
MGPSYVGRAKRDAIAAAPAHDYSAGPAAASRHSAQAAAAAEFDARIRNFRAAHHSANGGRMHPANGRISRIANAGELPA